jgi:hypothetical protein
MQNDRIALDLPCESKMWTLRADERSVAAPEIQTIHHHCSAGFEPFVHAASSSIFERSGYRFA